MAADGIKVDGPVGDASIPVTSDVSELTQVARVLLLIKENQLATAAILFFAWQAGIFMEAWFVVQGVCAP